MPTRLVLIRHGETAWSLSGRHTGRTDLPLTENGERQAVALRGPLAGFAFDLVLTSPLRRAKHTCDLAGFGDVARPEPDLLEWHYGAYEGLTSAAIHVTKPGWDVFADGCPGGESVEEIAARADRVLTGLPAIAGTVALFAHGHLLRVLAARWIGQPGAHGRHLALEPASISILNSRAGTRQIALWNRTLAASA